MTKREKARLKKRIEYCHWLVNMTKETSDSFYCDLVGSIELTLKAIKELKRKYKRD